MSTAPVAKLLTLAALLSGVFHIVWENAQAPLFAGYQNFWQHFWICLAVIPGDVALTLLVYGVIALVRRQVSWATSARRSDLLIAALLGAALAVGFERHALATERWAYTAAMPLLPGLGVGLTPVLQMAILLPLTFYWAGKWSKLLLIPTV